MLFTVGSKEDVKIIDVASGRRLCSTHAPVWDSLIEAADWRDDYQKGKELFAVFALWEGDTRPIKGAVYRQTLEAFNAVHIDTELPDWMYMFCDIMVESVMEKLVELSDPTWRERLRIIALDSILRFDFLI